MAIKGGMCAFSSGNIVHAPTWEGVYALYDHFILIYIGRSHGLNQTIRDRLQDHKEGRLGKGTRRATVYRREQCDDPVARERQLGRIRSDSR